MRSPCLVLYVPEQIPLTIASQERLWKVPPVNRKKVLKLNNHRCQYCGTTKRFTLDHLIPRSKSGKYSWDNVVTACKKWNTFKGSRTPTEAGMKLLHQPKTPIHPTIALLLRNSFELYTEQYQDLHSNARYDVFLMNISEICTTISAFA